MAPSTNSFYPSSHPPILQPSFFRHCPPSWPLSCIHACLYHPRTLLPSLFFSYFRYSSSHPFSSLPPPEQAVSVSNGTVSINLTITARWISRNGYILRRGSQFVLVSCSREYVCTVGRARARISTRIAMNMRLRAAKSRCQDWIRGRIAFGHRSTS